MVGAEIINGSSASGDSGGHIDRDKTFVEYIEGHLQVVQHRYILHHIHIFRTKLFLLNNLMVGNVLSSEKCEWRMETDAG